MVEDINQIREELMKVAKEAFGIEDAPKENGLGAPDDIANPIGQNKIPAENYIQLPDGQRQLVESQDEPHRNMSTLSAAESLLSAAESLRNSIDEFVDAYVADKLEGISNDLLESIDPSNGKDRSENTRKLQDYLSDNGAKLDKDGHLGPKTREAFEKRCNEAEQEFRKDNPDLFKRFAEYSEKFMESFKEELGKAGVELNKEVEQEKDKQKTPPSEFLASVAQYEEIKDTPTGDINSAGSPQVQGGNVRGA